MQPAILGDAGHAVLQHFEASRLDGELVHEDDVQHDPADGEQAVTDSIDRSGSGQPARHVEAEDRHQQGRRQSEQRGVVRFHVAQSEAAQQHHHRQCSDQVSTATNVRWGRILATRERSGRGF